MRSATAWTALAAAAALLVAPAAMGQDSSLDELMKDMLKPKAGQKPAAAPASARPPLKAVSDPKVKPPPPRKGKAPPAASDAPKDCTVESDWRYWDRAEIAQGYDAACRKVLDLARRTLKLVERDGGGPRSVVANSAAELDVLTKKISSAAAGADWQALWLAARRLRRRILFAHPLLQFDKLMVVRRGPPLYSHMCDQYLGRHSVAGPGLTVVEDWRSDSPAVRPMLPEGKLPVGSVHHPDLSWDGRRVAFGFCPHTEQDRTKRWFYIWEAAVDGSFVRQLTGVPGRDKLETQDGRQTVYVEDWDPCYLPDGDIVFLSTRNQGFGRCHGGRYTPSYVLYRCDADGSNIRRISWGEANEWDPSVLHDGTVIFTRWDYINRHDCLFQSLWTTRPDGTATAHYYGNNTPVPNMILEAHAIPDSHKIVATAGAHHSFTNGKLMIIDNRKGLDGLEPVADLTPEAGFPEMHPWNPTNGGSMKCTWCTPWPLSEELYLGSFSPQPMVGQGRVQRVNAFAAYVLDSLGGRELICRDPNFSCFSPIPLTARARPPVLASTLPPKAAPEGTYYLQDVYRSGRGEIPPGRARFLRVVGIIPQPTAGAAGRSRAANEVVKWVIGTVPIEPDGSAAFRAPANEPLLFQVLDANHMSLFSMRSQTYLQPGEKMSCVGCHEPEATTAPPQRMAPMVVRTLAPSPAPRCPTGLSFARVVQPVLDRYCIRCHGLSGAEAAEPARVRAPRQPKRAPKNAAALAELRGRPVATPAAGGAAAPAPARPRMSLLGEPRRGFSGSYEALTGRGGLVCVAQRNGETWMSKPMDYGSHAGRLAGMLLAGHPDADGRPRVRLDRDSFQRVAEWLDLNAQYTGDYTGRDRPENAPHPAEAEAALRQAVQGACDRCHAGMSAQPYAALVNRAQPSASRVLLAPLAAAAGGWGQCQAQWKSADDKPWRELRAKVFAAAGAPVSRELASGAKR